MENKKALRKNKAFHHNILIFACTLALVLGIGSLAIGIAAWAKKAQPVKEQAPQNANILDSLNSASAETSTSDKAIASADAALDGQDEGAQGQEAENKGKYDDLLANEELMAKERIYKAETASEDEINMLFAGDVLLDQSYAIMASLLQRGGEIDQAFTHPLLDNMRDADIFMINNEFTFTDRGAPLEDKQYTFRSSPKYADYLKQMGVDIVSLANNHSFDFGEISLLDTLDTLNGIGMPYVGAGRDIDEAAKPVCFIANDTKIAIISATQIERLDNPNTRGAGEGVPGVFRCWNPTKLIETVEEARKENDIVIVYIHWGTEKVETLDWAQEDQAEKLTKAGADVIIGAHPHCLQPVDYVNGVPVVYSLGNFFFNSRTLDTALARVIISTPRDKVGDRQSRIQVQIVPAIQQNCRTSLADDPDRSRIISYINTISKQDYLDEDGFMHIGG